MKNISIVVPTLNEQQNIEPLITRIHAALSQAQIGYEIIVIDDRSTDETVSALEHLAKQYPIRVFSKKGTPGKAFSLLEGFTHTKYPLIGIIDADLQYPPGVLPSMVDKILAGADIVVANRTTRHTKFHRTLLSRGFALFFSKILHQLDCDVQSGLKVFKREIIEAITVDPSPWTFDLEFLLKARRLGYRIDTVTITFDKRQYGLSKINSFKASVEIGRAAIKLKFSLSPTKHREQSKVLPNPHLARKRFSLVQKLLIFSGAILFVVSLLVDWHRSIFYIISLLTGLYFLDLLFNFFLIWRSFSTEPEITIDTHTLALERDWPSYTIFCPLYKEWHVVAQFADAIKKLDYPKDKLQVLLLLEEDDQQTIAHIKNMALPAYFTSVVVPHSLPKTKPKACNVGLSQARGEYCVIYDAEDIPEPTQLKKAVIAFEKSSSKIVCIQAKLNFYNPRQNLLTRLFTAEYSVWFEMILTGLQSIGAPIPLGGTSNHFRTAQLTTLGGWDPYNVTEDADLGIRLSKLGFSTAILNSTTMEEANSDLINWIHQRSRWIKGYMQTYFVHTRSIGKTLSLRSVLNAVFFQLIIGGKVLSMLVNPLMWFLTISYFVLRAQTGELIESFFIPQTFYMAVFSLIIGNFMYSYYYMIGIAKRRQWDLSLFTLLTPFYWLFISIAAFVALNDFIVSPYRWYKTRHGLHLQPKATPRKFRLTLGLPKRKNPVFSPT